MTISTAGSFPCRKLHPTGKEDVLGPVIGTSHLDFSPLTHGCTSTATLIAWDIETCPLDYDVLPSTHQDRHKHEYEFIVRRGSEISSDEAKRKAMSLHLMLGWICCISIVSGNERAIGDPRSWTAAAVEEEKELLEDFWGVLSEKKRDPSGTVGPLQRQAG